MTDDIQIGGGPGDGLGRIVVVQNFFKELEEGVVR